MRIYDDATLVKKDRKLMQQLDKEAALDRKLLARAKENDDVVLIAELDREIEGFKERKNRALQELAALKEEMKRLEAEELKEVQKLERDEAALVVRRGGEGSNIPLSAGVFASP